MAFEYVSDIDAEVTSKIISVKNPISGRIKATGIEEIIFDEENIDKEATEIVVY